MSLDAERWRERGRHIRAMESVSLTPRTVTRGWVTAAMGASLRRSLDELPAEERETAVALAAEGYLDEHVSRGGAVSAE